MTLKASAEKGASSLASRTSVGSRPRRPGSGCPRCPHRGHVGGARQVVDHGVEQGLHALVLERGAAQHRGHRDVERGLADVRDQALGRDLLLLEVVLHQLVVVLGDGLDQLGAGLLARPRRGSPGCPGPPSPGRGRPCRRWPSCSRGRSTPVKSRLGADRQLDGHRVGAQAVDHRLDRAVEVGADAVHLVDEGDARARGTCRPGARRSRTAAPRRRRSRTRPRRRRARAASAPPRP